VTAGADPPEGFVSDYKKLSEEVNSSTEAVQFTLTDVGSKWTSTKMTYAVKHKGKNTTLNSEIPMFDKKKGKGKKGPKGVAGILESQGGAALIPTQYTLYQNYPDPFNPSTTFRFDLPEAAVVTLKVYDVLGREVATLANNVNYEPGRYQLTFNASQLSSGVYLYRLIAGRFVDTKKMLLLK